MVSIFHHISHTLFYILIGSVFCFNSISAWRATTSNVNVNIGQIVEPSQLQPITSNNDNHNVCQKRFKFVLILHSSMVTCVAVSLIQLGGFVCLNPSQVTAAEITTSAADSTKQIGLKEFLANLDKGDISKVIFNGVNPKDATAFYKV